MQILEILFPRRMSIRRKYFEQMSEKSKPIAMINVLAGRRQGRKTREKETRNDRMRVKKDWRVARSF